MHDTTNLEARGIPSVFVASSVFKDAAEAQAVALGFPSAARVFVPHPIQDRTDAEMRQMAEAVVEQILSAITRAA